MRIETLLKMYLGLDQASKPELASEHSAQMNESRSVVENKARQLIEAFDFSPDEARVEAKKFLDQKEFNRLGNASIKETSNDDQSRLG